MNTTEDKYLVTYGVEVVELYCNDMTKEEAQEIADWLISKHYKNVRIRKEDPNHPTWPANFDAEGGRA